MKIKTICFDLLFGLSLVLMPVSTLSLISKAQSPFIQQDVYFDDSGTNVVITTVAYEVAFSKRDGGIVYIKNGPTGQSISNGSLNSCLWVINYYNGDNTESCADYITSATNRFTYAWLPSTNQLILHYQPDPLLTKVEATITATFSPDNWFDLQLFIKNDGSEAPKDVKFPADLVFEKTSIEEALLPILPGVVLESDFFKNGVTPEDAYETEYPGTMFADFVSVLSTQGRFTLYSISDNDKIAPVRLGFFFKYCANDASTCLTHNFRAGAANGETWISPKVRIHLGETYYDSIIKFRIDNGIEDYRPIEEKLGLLYPQISQLPLYKADATAIRIDGETTKVTFSRYPEYLSNVPYPGILHLVAYWQRGFDENYPDFLPPLSELGTVEDMANMFHQVQSMGYLIMPYINPTWWDDESPTLQNLPAPLTIDDLAVFTAPDASPLYEYYGDHGGYVMSPYPEFVQQRLEVLMQQMKQEVPSDLINEDQVGGRSHSADFNPSSPDSASYSQGWLEHTRKFSNTLLTCEMGFDRLAATETGFHGSIILDRTSDDWQNRSWHMYPFAPILLRDKVLLYHHTEVRGSTISKELLSLNLGFGYMLGYDLGHGPGMDNPWLRTSGAFQKYVISEYANERILDYQYLLDDVTQTRFENHTVTMNWDQDHPFTVSKYELPPGGSVITDTNGTLTAGIFTRYNNHSLSGGDHYLIEKRTATDIRVWQPMGNDTDITIDLLPVWSTMDIVAQAVDKNSQIIANVPATITTETLTFPYQQQVKGQSVEHYQILSTAVWFNYKVYLPVVLRK